MNISGFLEKAMSNGPASSPFPSTKRIGHIIGLFIASIVSLVMLGAIVGLTLNVTPLQFQFVYSTLNSTITWIVGMLIGAGSGAYVMTKKTKVLEKDNDA